MTDANENDMISVVFSNQIFLLFYVSQIALYILSVVLIKLGVFSKCKCVVKNDFKKQKKTLKYEQQSSFFNFVGSAGGTVDNADALKVSRGFSDAKVDQRNKILVTYDIYENKRYRPLLKLTEFLFSNPLSINRERL